MTSYINFQNAVPRIPDSPFPEPFNWQINKGEIWSILGSNGSGKTRFSEVLASHYSFVKGSIDYAFYDREQAIAANNYRGPRQYFKTISFDSVYTFADYKEMYYQQRFDSYGDEAPSVAEIFHEEDIDTEVLHKIADILNLHKLMDRRLIQLSSGELRKLVIGKILLEKPKVLIFDNPFIGLDIPSRKHLDEVFPALSESGIQLFFLVPSVSDMPIATTHTLQLEDGRIISAEKGGVEEMQAKFKTENISTEIDWSKVPSTSEADFEEVSKMENIDIAYGENVVKQNVNWTIKKGENWVLLGNNGSGKSTLLSFLFADNPASYNKNLTLFDRKRGTGESIWDIKKRIGFTSSEMHLYYRKNVSCLKVVESGFFDSVGLYHKCSEAQTKIAEYFFEVFQIGHLMDKSFLRISSGEQRLICFLRALVKNPPLLILDEPYQGIDEKYKQLCNKVVNAYCAQPDKTLVFVTHNQEEIPQSVDNQLKL